MARKDGKVQALKQVPLFWGVSDADLSMVASIVDEIQVPAGKTLIKEGDYGRELFIILDGEAKISLGRRTIRTVGRGEVIGELALLDQGPRSATVTAQTPLRIYVVEARAFESLLGKAPKVAIKIMKGLAGRLRETETKGKGKAVH